MPVVRCGNDNRIDILLFQEYTKIRGPGDSISEILRPFSAHAAPSPTVNPVAATEDFAKKSRRDVPSFSIATSEPIVLVLLEYRRGELRLRFEDLPHRLNEAGALIRLLDEACKPLACEALSDFLFVVSARNDDTNILANSP